MNKSVQFAICAAILGVGALVFILAFGFAVYGLLNGGNPNLLPMAMLFGLFGFTYLALTLSAVFSALKD